MFTKTIKQISVVAFASIALSAQAATVQVNGVITTCLPGLCTLLSGLNHEVNATFEIGTDGTYNASQMPGTPSMTIDSNQLPIGNGVLGFYDAEYASNEMTHPLYGPMTLFSTAEQTAAGWPVDNIVAAAPMSPPTGSGFGTAYTDVTVTGGVASGILGVAGIGTSSGAPIFGRFDLTNQTFDAWAFAGADGIQNLASGTFTTTVVPVPAAAWLMASALMGLFGIRRAKS